MTQLKEDEELILEGDPGYEDEDEEEDNNEIEVFYCDEDEMNKLIYSQDKNGAEICVISLDEDDDDLVISEDELINAV